MRFAAVMLCAIPALAQYSARQESGLVRLEDAGRQTVVLINPGRGNNAFQMRVKGKDVVRFPHASVEEYLKATGRGMAGVPFLGPWANRMDEMAFYANGKKYTFNPELGNVRPGANNIPIHGFLTTAPQWQVVEAKADGKSAWSTSRLEFYKQPLWMAQWPFAHTIEMTYRLQDGALEVFTKIDNLSVEAMPVAIGFHPYFQVNDAPRDQWTFGIAAKSEWLLAPTKIPTGEKRPIEQSLPKAQGGTLQGLALDHVFGDLVRDGSGKATMWVQGKSEKVEVVFGPNYRAAVVYAPAGAQNNFICFEPMAGITNAVNMAHKGTYGELQSIAPGGSWTESFWIRPSGF
jgi:aldose 1-epimerase